MEPRAFLLAVDRWMGFPLRIPSPKRHVTAVASPARWGRTALAYSTLARLTIVVFEPAGAIARASLSLQNA